MFVKALVAAALVAAPSSVSSDALTSDIAYFQYPQVRQVVCDEGKGSAVQTDKGWVSVNHVTSMTGCTIDGWPAVVIAADEGLDFSRIVTLDPRNAPVKISCEGFVEGRYYWSAGFAHGLGYQTNVRIRALGVRGWMGFDAFDGGHTVIPGMSGGVVMNERGEMVGTVNAYNPYLGLSFSRALKDTALCK